MMNLKQDKSTWKKKVIKTLNKTKQVEWRFCFSKKEGQKKNAEN